MTYKLQTTHEPSTPGGCRACNTEISPRSTGIFPAVSGAAEQSCQSPCGSAACRNMAAAFCVYRSDSVKNHNINKCSANFNKRPTALQQPSRTHNRKLLSSDSVAVFKLRLKTFLFSQAFSSFSAHWHAAWPSTCEVTTLWRYTNLFIIIIINWSFPWGRSGPPPNTWFFGPT